MPKDEKVLVKPIKQKTVDPKNTERDTSKLVKVTFAYVGKNKNKKDNLYTSFVTPEIAEMYRTKMKGSEKKEVTYHAPKEVR